MTTNKLHTPLVIPPEPPTFHLSVDGKYLEGFDSYFGHMLLVANKEDAKIYSEKLADHISNNYPILQKEPITDVQNQR